jgi:Spy/CpxP family protein refolding chaperone
MKKAILVTLLASTLGLGAAAVQADNTTSENGKGYSKQDGGKHHGKRGGKRGGGKMMKRMAKKLNLTEAQQTQIKTFREAQKEQHQSLRTEKQALRTEMKALDTTSADYQSQVAVIADKKANLDRQGFIQRSSARQQFESVLTAEQRVTLKEMKESRKNRGGKRGGKRHGKQSAE